MRKLFLLIFLLVLCIPSYGAMLCTNTFSLQEKAQAKWGGSTSQWKGFFSDSTLSQQDSQVLENYVSHAPKSSWFSKKANSLLFFRINTMQNVLRASLDNQLTAEGKGDWSQLSLVERRALLLKTYNKFWWQVDSDQVSGWTRYLKPSFLISQALQKKNSASHDLNVMDLVHSPSNTRFWAHLLQNFSNEKRWIRDIKEEGYDKESFIEYLKKRKRHIFENLKNSQASSFRQRLARMELLKMDYILKTLLYGRKLTKAEIKKMGNLYGVKVSQLFLSRLGEMSLTSIQAAVSLVSTMAIAYLVGQLFFEDEEPQESESLFNQDPVVKNKSWSPNLSDKQRDAFDRYNLGEISSEELQNLLTK